MASDNASFSVTYDRTTKVVSCLAIVLILAPAAATQSSLLFVVAVLLLLLVLGYSPRRYAVEDRSIVVHRLAGRARIPLDELQAVRPATSADLAGSLRLWGSGGLFGYYGLFRTRTLGKCWWYLTSRANAIVVITANVTALFSPDDTNGFLTAVRNAAPVSQPRTDGLDGAARRIGWGPGLILAAVAAVVLAALVFAFTYAPGPPAYTLTSSALKIQDRFYPVTVEAAEVDLDRVRVVDIAADPEWRPLTRTNGFANAHYRSGWFRTANGLKVRMYRADATRLVLLPPKGETAAVLLELPSPEDFVRELRREWSSFR